MGVLVSTEMIVGAVNVVAHATVSVSLGLVHLFGLSFHSLVLNVC